MQKYRWQEAVTKTAYPTQTHDPPMLVPPPTGYEPIEPGSDAMAIAATWQPYGTPSASVVRWRRLVRRSGSGA